MHGATRVYDVINPVQTDCTGMNAEG